jgi:hypothetical protein
VCVCFCVCVCICKVGMFFVGEIYFSNVVVNAGQVN